MQRSKRQLATIREHQPTPLTPYSVTSDSPATPAVQPAPTLSAAQIAAEREERITIAVRSNAEIFRLKMEKQWEEHDHKEAVAGMQQQFIRLQSKIERLEQDISAQWANFNSRWAEAAEFHKVKLLELVRDGKFCSNAAAPPAEIRQEAANKLERIESQCQNQ